MTTYRMTTLYNGTRIRTDHTTFADVLTSVNANVTVTGDDLWTAPADGNEVKSGDKWVHVSYNGVTGWMAYIHKGQAICKDLTIVTNPVPDPTPTFPESFELVDKNGNRAEYVFVRIIE